MRAVSSLWKSIFNQPWHSTEVKAVIDGTTYGPDLLYSVKQTQEVFQGRAPGVGACCASTLEISIVPTARVPRMAEIHLYVRLTAENETSEWIEAGTYYVDTRAKSEDGQSLRLTAYDSMLKCDQPYLENTSFEEWPQSEDDVVEDIADAIGVDVDSRTELAGYDVPYPNDYTMREVLGYIGAANGGNWIITPENKLLLVKLKGENSLLGANRNAAIQFGDSVILLSTGFKYDDARSLMSADDDDAILFGNSLLVLSQTGGGSDGSSERTDIYRNAQGFHNLGVLQPFTGVKVWYNRENSYVDQEVETEGETTTEKVEVENAYFAGDDSGRVLELDCPWGTQAMADAILTQIEGYTYQGATVDAAQITPAAELGDVVICDGVGFSLSSINVSYTGDYLPTIGAPADEEVDYEYHYESQTERKLSRKVSLGDSYYGFKVTRENGIEVVNIVDGVETTRMILNSSTQAFYNSNGDEALYFDAEAGKYKFVGDVTVLSGSLNINNNFIVDTDGNVTTNGNVTLQGANTKIIAPIIKADSFDVFPEDITDAEMSGLTIPAGFNLYGRSAGLPYNFLNISQNAEYTVFRSPAGGYAYWGFDSTNFSGTTNFNGTNNFQGRMWYTASGYSGSDSQVACVGHVKALIQQALRT